MTTTDGANTTTSSDANKLKRPKAPPPRAPHSRELTEAELAKVPGADEPETTNAPAAPVEA